MKKLLSAILLLCTINVFSQENKPKETTFEFYGFVRYEAYLDTYKGLNAANEQFFVVPLYGGIDANGKHINHTPTYNFSSMATRVGVRISGPEIFNAKTSANIETDFAGDLANNPAMFRVRQANAVFTWKKSSLLVGQTWHPFWSGKVYPTVGGLNTGSPFQPFNRSPQIRFDYKPNSLLTLSAAVVSEFQYKSYGFTKVDSICAKGLVVDKSDCFNRNATFPEMTANIELNSGGFTLQRQVGGRCARLHRARSDPFARKIHHKRAGKRSFFCRVQPICENQIHHSCKNGAWPKYDPSNHSWRLWCKDGRANDWQNDLYSL